MSGAFAVRRLGPHSVFPILGVTDMRVVTVSAIEADVFYTLPTGATDTPFFDYKPVDSDEPWTRMPFTSPLNIVVDDATSYLTRIVPRTAGGEVGPRSNVFPYETYGPSVLIKDWKKQTFQSTTAGLVNDCDLVAMGLNFAAGDTVLLFTAYHHNAITNSIPTQGVATGWTELFFDTMPVSNALSSGRILEKLMVGGETTVDVIDDVNVSTASRRINYIAVVLTPVNGTLIFNGLAPLVSGTRATGANPAAQTIPSASPGGVTIAWSLASCHPAGAVNQSFAAAPFTDIYIDNTGGTAIVANSRLKLKVFPNGSTPVDIVTDTDDFGSNLLVSGHHTVV